MIERIDTSPGKLKNFGILFAVVGGLIGAWTAWHGSPAWPWWIGGGAIFLIAGFVARGMLKPVYIAWMTLAFILGWINTRVILGIFFYLVLTPIGLVLRWTGKDLLDQKMEPKAKSYWKKRERRAVDPKRYERLF